MRAFSILEIIISIVVLAIIISFGIPKFNTINENSNLLTLKSEFALIQSSIARKSSQNILLQNSNTISSLDDAKINTQDEELFKNVLEIPIISTSINIKKYGKWTKISNKKYLFFTQNRTFEFLFEDGHFFCASEETFCKDIE